MLKKMISQNNNLSVKKLLIFYRYKTNDPDLMAFITANTEATEAFGNGLPSDFFPILKYVKLPIDRRVNKLVQAFFKLFYSEFEKHRENFDPGMQTSSCSCWVRV